MTNSNLYNRPNKKTNRAISVIVVVTILLIIAFIVMSILLANELLNYKNKETIHKHGNFIEEEKEKETYNEDNITRHDYIGLDDENNNKDHDSDIIEESDDETVVVQEPYDKNDITGQYLKYTEYNTRDNSSNIDIIDEFTHYCDDELSYEISYESFELISDTYGNCTDYKFIACLSNKCNKNIWTTCDIDLLDKDNNVIESMYLVDNTTPVVEPGSYTFMFNTSSYDVFTKKIKVDDVKSVRINYDIDLYSDVVEKPNCIYSRVSWSDADDFAIVTCDLDNVGKDTIDYFDLYVVAYDENYNPVGIMYSFASDFESGSTRTFQPNTITVPGGLTLSDIKYYEIIFN